MTAVEELLKSICVYDCLGTEKVRIGNNADGGYIALDEICRNTKTLLSFGVEDNVTFEANFVENYPKSAVVLYDHTVNGLPQQNDNFCFVKKGVSSTTTGDFVAISEIINRSSENITMKMDVEWDEWEILKSMSPSDFDNVDQILIEFHFALIDTDEKFVPNQNPDYKLTPYFCNFYKTIYNKINDDLLLKYKEVIDMLNDRYYAFHIHPNNSLKKINYGKHSFPPLLEMSFVRKDLISNALKTKQSFPVEGLDFPNKPYKPELENYYPIIKE